MEFPLIGAYFVVLLQSQLTDVMVDAMIRLATAFHSIDQHVYNLYLLSYTGLRDTSAKSMFAAKNHLRGVSSELVFIRETTSRSIN